MARIAAILVLVASPLVLSGGLVLLGLFIHGVGRAFGSQKPPTPVVLAMLGLAVVAAMIGLFVFVRIAPASSRRFS